MFPDKKGNQLSFSYLFLAKKDEDGHVKTEPKNITTKKIKRGKDDSVYFAKPSYICTGDLYKSKS
jgi:hypothetical protein